MCKWLIGKNILKVHIRGNIPRSSETKLAKLRNDFKAKAVISSIQEKLIVMFPFFYIVAYVPTCR